MEIKHKEINGLFFALARLEQRITTNRSFLKEGDARGIETQASLTKGEVETLEALIKATAKNITGSIPGDEWETMDSFCVKYRDNSLSGYVESQIGYLSLGLNWIQKTRMYLEYLRGMISE